MPFHSGYLACSNENFASLSSKAPVQYANKDLNEAHNITDHCLALNIGSISDSNPLLLDRRKDDRLDSRFGVESLGDRYLQSPTF